jgi:hypothetical protein
MASSCVSVVRITSKLRHAASMFSSSISSNTIDESPLAQLIDGKAIAQRVRAKVRDEVEFVKAQCGRPPKLGVVLVGDRGDSEK